MTKRGFLSLVFGAAAALATIAGPAGDVQAQYQYPDRYPLQPTTVEEARHPKLGSTSKAPVGASLILVMDTSGSMSDEEFKIELQATAEAINSPLFRSTVKYKYGNNSIAIAVVDFDSTAAVRIPWADIRGSQINDKPYHPGQDETSKAPDEMDALAAEIVAMPRRSSGSTNTGAAAELSKRLFLLCPWKTEKRVLDLFTDGTPDSVEFLVTERAALANMGTTINGFAIVNEEPNLEDSLKENLVTKEYKTSPDGLHSEPGRVWAVARNLQSTGNQQSTLMSFFNEVTRAMKQKISVEYTSVDEYERQLARRGERPEFPLPAPVAVRPR